MHRLLPWLGIACVLLAGCDYTVPVVREPGTERDAALAGAWERAKPDGGTERLLVLPLRTNEYLVAFPAGAPDAMFARAWLGRAAGMRLAQLEWIGTAKGKPAEGARVFQAAGYARTGDTLTVRLLNADTVGREATTTEALVQALVERTNDPALFRDDLVFRRVQ